jgi:hypothetical protein
MGFNRRKIEAERKAKADAEAAARRASDRQLLADAEGLIAAWNERQARRKRRSPNYSRTRLNRTFSIWWMCLSRLTPKVSRLEVTGFLKSHGAFELRKRC